MSFFVCLRNVLLFYWYKKQNTTMSNVKQDSSHKTKCMSHLKSFISPVHGKWNAIKQNTRTNIFYVLFVAISADRIRFTTSFVII